MKSNIQIALLALTTLCAAPLMAQSHYSGTTPTPENRGKNLSPEQKKKILKKFDKDRDGKLNAQEAAAARAALQAKKARQN